MKRSPLIAACLVAAACAGAAPGPAPAAGPFVKVFFPDGKSVTAELAVDDEQRARGLMFRESIPADAGMLFVFPRPDYHPFWMKNTLIELDMLWLDAGKRVIEVERRVPPCKADPCPSYGGTRPASYVLELKGGEFDARGLKVGDRLDFVIPPGVRIE